MARGLSGLGHEVLGIWTDSINNPSRHSLAWGYKHLSGRRAPWTIRRFKAALRAAEEFKPDIVFCFKAIHVPQELLLSVKSKLHIHYSPDDLCNKRFTSQDYLDHERAWTLIVTTKRYNLPELASRGTMRTLQVQCAYDPTWHFPAPSTMGPRFDVGFIGTATDRPGRIEFMGRLAAIYQKHLVAIGNGWPSSAIARMATTSPPVYGEQFSYRVASITSNLVLLAPRDQHTTRSYEIPAARGLFLGERTEEHTAIIEDYVEGLLYSSEEELIERLHWVERNQGSAREIASRGWRRITRGKNSYGDRASEILNHVLN
jgi:hypothetical protein